MSRPTDKPMARAQAHLAAGRLPEAIGAFRAVLGIDPSFMTARLGLADALAARGQRSVAVEGLVEAAERCAEHEQHEPALLLYGKALAIEPSRADLHLDLAVVEHALGRKDDAIARVEVLAERYMTMGRTDEAADLLRFVASWEDEGKELEAKPLEPFDDHEFEEATVVARNPLLSAPRAAKPAPRVQQPASTETVVRATVLVRPDGTLWFGDEASSDVPEIDEAELTVARAVSAPIVLDEIEEADPDADMETRVAIAPSFENEKTIARADASLLEASRALIERRRSAAPARAGAPSPTPKVVVATRPGVPPSPPSKPKVVVAARPGVPPSPPSKPKVVVATDARMQVARAPRPAAAPPARTEPRPTPSVAASRPQPRPQPPASARPTAPSPVASRPQAQAFARPAAQPASRPAAQPTAAQGFSRPTPPPVSRPAAIEPAMTGAAASTTGPLVDRLRKRAGIGPEVAAVPRNTKGLGTEPIVIRRPNLGPRPEREEEVTHPRFRHPRGSMHPASH
jgi:hypothetical protein